MEASSLPNSFPSIEKKYLLFCKPSSESQEVIDVEEPEELPDSRWWQIVHSVLYQQTDSPKNTEGEPQRDGIPQVYYEADENVLTHMVTGEGN